MLQAILFDIRKWDADSALKWMIKNKYNPIKLHITRNYIRFRLKTPKKSKNYRTVDFGQGIKAIYTI